jgi:hypothetical protein
MCSAMCSALAASRPDRRDISAWRALDAERLGDSRV